MYTWQVMQLEKTPDATEMDGRSRIIRIHHHYGKLVEVGGGGGAIGEGVEYDVLHEYVYASDLIFRH